MGPALVSLGITLVVAPAQLKIDAATPPALVTVTAARPPRLWCSTGTLSPLEPRGAGRFEARFLPPATGRPAVALLAALDDEAGEAATATVALAARTEIPVDTEPGAQVVALLHGRRSTARANGAGHARVVAWVWPGERSATVTALDAAGNATTREVALELPRASGLFLRAPPAAAAGAPVRVWAFAAGGAAPSLAVSGGALGDVVARAGVATAIVRACSDVTVTATAADEHVEQRIRVGGAGDAGAAVEEPLSPWELGAGASGHYSGDFSGLGAAAELRRRLGRVAVGLDLEGRWATGVVGNEAATLGGIAARVPVEVRFAVAPRVVLFVGAAVGGHWARLQRTPAAGPALLRDDGGPTLAALTGVLLQVGPGRVELALGYCWAPLVGSALRNVDGIALTVGYRAARWRPRHGGRRRRAHRRRRAPGR